MAPTDRPEPAVAPATPAPEEDLDPRSRELEHTRAPFIEHLVELRSRLWKAVLGVFAAAVIAAFFYRDIYIFITDPLYAVLEANNLPQVMKFRTLSGAFLFHFKTSILAGVFFGVPVVLYQLWQFVAPGLYSTERKVVIPFVFMSSVCFIGGGLFGYHAVLPEAFDYLISFTVSEGHQLLPDITIEDYLGFTTKLLLGFGLAFELPVAMGFFAAIGLVTHHLLLRVWRWAVVVIFIVAALLTPPDYITQIMMAVPLLALYGISIGVAFVFTRRRAAADAAALADGPPPDAARVLSPCPTHSRCSCTPTRPTTRA